MPDRFDSREDIEWHHEYFSQGEWARLSGVPLSENPYESGLWAEKSWRAGWVDMDMRCASGEFEAFKRILHQEPTP